MKNLLLLLTILVSSVFIFGCGDSLGINGADYTKSQLDNQVFTRDTMINFKKVIIETVITKTDTVITYIPVNRIYDPVYANRYELQMIESFVNHNKNTITERLRDNNIIEVVSLLNYNPITPELSFKLKILNEKNLGEPMFKERNEIIKSFELEIQKLPVLQDGPIPLKDFITNKKVNFELLLLSKKGVSRRILTDGVLGNIIFHDRNIIDGQLRSVAISGLLLLPAKEEANLQNYNIEFTTNLFFPEF